MNVQALLTAIAMNLMKLATAPGLLFWSILRIYMVRQDAAAA